MLRLSRGLARAAAVAALHRATPARACGVRTMSSEAKEGRIIPDLPQLLRGSSFGLNTFFYLPEQGMEGWDPLSRSSAFLLRARPGFGKKYHVVGTAHVTHPFLFTHLYADDRHAFLHFVREDATMYHIDIRASESGVPIKSARLGPRAFRHPTLDLVVLHIEDEARFEEDMDEVDIGPAPLELAADAPPPDAALEYVGHNFFKDPQDGEEFLIPYSTAGRLTRWAGSRFFGSTKGGELEMGMCGGPVVHGGKVVGMVEGLVSGVKESAPEELKAVVGNAVCIGAGEIAKFVKEIEASAPTFESERRED
eukprot:tig00000691_g3156.t1